jgi:aspartate/methionine/tyrosine aminotransferase
MIITGGEQEARFLAIKGLALSGRRLVLPAVVHPGVRKAAALSGIERSLIPFDLERGVPDLDAARDALRLGPSALYLESPHRLTGRLIPAGDDAALEAIAVEAGALVVRDTGLAGWVDPGTPGPHGGTATKAGVETVRLGTVWTGAGVEGWLIAYLVLPPAVYPEPRRLKQVMAMCTSVPVQWGAFGVLEEGEPEYQHQLLELAAIRARALRAWRGDVFAGDVVTLVAVRLPEALDASRLPRGMPGAAFGAPRAMRFTVTPDAGIVDAMRTLAQAVARGADA